MRDQPSCWCLTGSWCVCTTSSSIFGSHHRWIFSFNNSLLTKTGIQYLDSLRTSSPGRSVDGAGRGKIALNYVSGIWISICIENVDAKCWLAEMTLAMTSLPLAGVFRYVFFFFFTLALVSASRWLAEIGQLSWRGATGALEVEFNFERRICKLSFLFPPRPQSAPESLLAGRSTWNPEATAWNPKSKRPGLSWIPSHWVIKIVTWSSLS